jgi:Ca2+-binding RTX toxin-like protein
VPAALSVPAFAAETAGAACTVVGTSGNDVLIGTAGADVLCGRGGDDVLRGLGGNDVLRGGAGADRLVGGGGDDELTGGTGDDQLRGGAGAGQVLGGSDAGESRVAGDDLLSGGSGDDRLIGGRGDDQVQGGAGADLLIGGGGDDRLQGGDGKDRLNGQGGSDSMAGGSGSDTVTYAHAGTAVTVTVGVGANDGRSGEADDVRASVETVVGSDFADRLTGTNNANRLRGGGGADLLQGLGGNDSLYGGAGADRLRAGRGNDDLFGGPGTDALEALDGQDFVDQLFCGDGLDTALADSVDHVAATCEHDLGKPVAVNDTATVAEDSGATAVPVLANDTNAGGGPISIGAVTQPGHGTVVVTGGGTGLTYKPGPDYCNNPPGTTPDTFTYTLAPGGSTATVKVRVTCVEDNAAPVAAAQSVSATEDTTKTITLSASDADGNVLTLAKGTGPAHGTLGALGPVSCSGATPNVCTADVVYTPIADYNGADSFTFTANDGTVGSAAATVSITVAPVNDAPVATPGSRTVDEGGSLDLGALVSDVETSDAHLTYEVVTPPAHGAVTAGTYEPDANFSGADSFTYKVTDRGDPDNCGAPGPGCDAPRTSSTETVSITVEPVNDAPSASPFSDSVAEDATLPIDLTALVSDAETIDANLTYTVVTGPAHGGLTGTGGSRDYNPDPNFNGPDSFTYKVTDRGDPDNCSTAPCDGAKDSNTETVSITVDPVNDTPSASDGAGTTDEDTPLAVDLAALANDVETADANLTYTIVTGPAHGSVTGSAGSRVYTPDLNFNGTDSFTYQVTDRGDPDNCGAPGPGCDATETSTTETVSITVDPVNDAPAARDDSRITNEDTPLAVDLAALADDLETTDANLTFTVIQPDHGTVTGAGATRTYTPDPDFNGTDSFAYQVTDRGDPDNCSAAPCDAAESATGTITVTVGAVNDAPVNTVPAGPITAVQDTDTPITGISVADVDAGTADLDVTVSVEHGVLTVDTTVLGGVGAVQVIGNGSASVLITASQAEISTTLGAASGLVYHGGLLYTGPETLTVSTSDLEHTGSGGVKTDTDTLAIDVVPPNASPVAAAQSVGTDEDTPKTITLSASDVDGDVLTLAKGTGPDHGTLGTVGAVTCSGATPSVCTADVVYTPSADYSGPDSFTFTAADASATSAPATVTITVNPVDDAPTAVNDTATVAEDSGASPVDVLANDTDIDLGPKAIASASDPANGTVVLTGGSPGAHTGLTYQPDPNYCNDPPETTPDTFTYTLVGGSTATVSLTVTCAPDDPVVDASAGSTSYTENAAATVVDAAVTVTDPDAGTTITGATVQITGNAGALDVLALAGVHPGITAAFGGDTLTLTGDASPAAYQSALRDVTFRNSSDDPSTAPRTVTFTVTDDTARSGSDIKGLTITAVDDPPLAITDSATVLEDAAATAVTVLTNDTDVDGGPKTISSANDPANGTVLITGGGTGLTYQPDPNYCNSQVGGSPDTFAYALAPGGSSAAVAMTVTCVNDAPSFTKGPNQANVANQLEDGTARAYTINPWATGISSGPANESGQTVSFEITSNTNTALFSAGPAVSPTGVLTFTTDPANSGTATIDLRITDTGGTADGGVNASATQSFTIQTVVPPPVAVNDSHTATGNVSINVNTVAEGVLQRGTDDSLFGATITNCGSANTTTTAVSGGTCTTASASGGNVVLNTNGTFTYDPPVGFPGTDHFFYRLTNAGGTATGDVTITVSDMLWFVDNDAPTCTTLGANCGRLSSPFSTLAAFQAVNTGAVPSPQGGQTVFLYTGTGAYTEGVTLRNGQRLAGQGASASLTAISGVSLAPFSAALPTTNGVRPTLTTSNPTTNAITLGTGNTVRGLDIGNKTGSGISGTNFATLTLTEVNITGTGQALNLNTGTANATFGTVSSSSGTNGIALTNADGTLSFGTGGTLTGSTGDELLISGGSNTYTYPGAITNTGGNRAVTITGRTAGTINLTGQITDTGGTGDGISLTSNTGGTINLTGGVQLSTGTVAAFTATGGGTVTVTGAANTLTTTTGTALNVANTTIGASGLTFRGIASNGASSGIVLNTTGSSGGLTVSGNGGTCTSAVTCTGGAIQNSTGAGINLTSVGGGVSLTRVSVNNGGDDGIRGSSVGGLSLANSVVLNNGNAVGERGIDMFDLTGSGGIASSSITGSSETNVRIENNTATALTAFNVTASTISNTSTVTGDDGILVLNDGAGAMSVSVTGSTFTDNKGDHFQAASDADASGSINAIFDNNTLDTTLNGPSGGSPVIIGGGITINTSGTLDINFHVGNNSIQHAFDDAINLNLDPGSQAGANFVGTLTGNTIGTTGVLDSGSESSNTITFAAKGAGTATVSITNNTVRQYSNAYGIMVAATEGSPIVNATVTGNVVKEPGTFALNGIRVDAGATAGPPADASTLCVTLTGNNATGSAKAPPSDTDIRLRQRFGTTIRLPGYTGANNDTTTVNNFVSGNNTGSPTVSSVFNVPGGGGFVGGAACTVP